MRAVVYQGPFKVNVERVPDPKLEQPTDVIVKITSTCICGSDLHMYKGRTAAAPALVFGHENMGTVEEVGKAVPSIKKADRVSMPFSVACGFCKNCLASFTGFCLTVNPGFAGGAYGYVAWVRTWEVKQSTSAFPMLTSTVCPCRANLSTSLKRTFHFLRTSSAPDTTAPIWQKSAPAIQWRYSVLARWASWQRSVASFVERLKFTS